MAFATRSCTKLKLDHVRPVDRHFLKDHYEDLAPDIEIPAAELADAPDREPESSGVGQGVGVKGF